MMPGAPLAIIAKSPGFGPFGRSQLPFPFSSAQTRLTANGRTAIWAGLCALRLPPGARILVPAWHCGSEIDAILAAGATPVLYRLMPDLSADLDHVKTLLHQGAAAVYIIHYFGQPQPVVALRALADQVGARLIEDLALGMLSIGPDGIPLGQVGDMTVFSLVKSLAVPDGGALWLRDRGSTQALSAPPLRQTLAGLRSIRSNSRRTAVRDRTAGQDQTAMDAWTGEGGFPFDAPKRRASLVTRWLIHLTDHDRLRQDRQSAWRAIKAALPARPGLHPLIPDLHDGACPAFFPLWVDDPDRLLASLSVARVESVRFWRRFHPGMDLSTFPEITRLKRHVLRLPVHGGIDSAAVARIVAACQNA